MIHAYICDLQKTGLTAFFWGGGLCVLSKKVKNRRSTYLRVHTIQHAVFASMKQQIFPKTEPFSFVFISNECFHSATLKKYRSLVDVNETFFQK